MSRIPRRVANVFTTYSKTTIVALLLVTAAIGAGVTMLESDSGMGQFETDSEAADAQTFIENNFVIDDGSDETTQIQLVQRAQDGNALSKSALTANLALQQELLADESISETLAEQRPVFSVANIVGRTAVDQQADIDEPTLANQIAAIDRLDQAAFEDVVANVLSEDSNSGALDLMPTSYDDPGSTTAAAHLTIVTQATQGGSADNPNGFTQPVQDAQLEVRDLAQAAGPEYEVFGAGIIFQEIDQSLGDSIAIVGPLALLFVVVALTVAYRDLLDIVLGVVGILAVLIWTFGFMGWAGISFNQILISVPVLLIGLSIDYAIHVFMRHREQRNAANGADGVSTSMTVALGGVGVALVWVTATAAIGFLANLTSPIGPLQDFGIVSAFGVFAALFVFGALIPALKVEADELFERLGRDRHKSAFGTGDGAFTRVLSVGATAARRFPLVVVAVTLVITAGGVAGATLVDTSFEQEDFLADEPPGWIQSLPGPLEPGEYGAKDDLQFVQANFQQEGSEAELLIQSESGELVTDDTLTQLASITERLDTAETTFKPPPGDQADTTTPLSLMQTTAANNPEGAFAQAFADAAGTDTADPGELREAVPEEDVPGLFEQLLSATPQAEQFVYVENGNYEALRIQTAIDASFTASEVASELRDVATAAEDETGGALTVTATGSQVVSDETQDALLSTVIQGLALTTVSVFVFLAGAYRLTGNPASLGIVTLLPVVFSVTWILGTMWLVGIPFNSLTGTITSLTVGLGIAYSIHISSRYELELRRQGDVWDAMETTVTGTGGALLGSAATTVGGFGTLAFAIFPVLQQFGIITGLTIIYAFLASVFVLPSLLVLWTRYLGPSAYFPPHDAETGDADQEPTAADGGRDV